MDPFEGAPSDSVYIPAGDTAGLAFRDALLHAGLLLHLAATAEALPT